MRTVGPQTAREAVEVLRSQLGQLHPAEGRQQVAVEVAPRLQHGLGEKVVPGLREPVLEQIAHGGGGASEPALVCVGHHPGQHAIRLAAAAPHPYAVVYRFFPVIAVLGLGKPSAPRRFRVVG